jgi:uncharacterized protein YkwD
LLLAFCLQPSVSPLGTQPQDTLYLTLEQRALESVNRERVALGLRALQMDAHLTQAARQHSQDMAERRFMNHINPDGYSFVDRARLAGIRRTGRIAENLAMHRGTTDPVTDIVRGWMNSPHHRENILNRRFKYTGLGVARAADGTLYFTQLFADRP